MANLHVEVDGEVVAHDGNALLESDSSVRIVNDAAENGVVYDEGDIDEDEESEESMLSEPLNWMNSASLIVDSEDDSITARISTADPRGGFCFTVRRMPNGQIILHVPHPGESLLHDELEELHTGTYIVKSTKVVESND